MALAVGRRKLMALIVRRSPSLPKRPIPGTMALTEEVPSAAGAAEETNAAGSAETKGPDTSWVVMGYALVILGAVAAWVLFWRIDPKPFVAAAGFSAFAPLYVLAQSIERVMEPFVKYLGSTDDEKEEGSDKKTTKDEAKAKLETAVAALNNGEGSPDTAAHYLALLTQIRRNTTVIAWAIASATAMVLCGIFGFRLLSATGLDVPWGGLDVVITGLAVGSGTKPLHDLISNMQKSKDEKSNPEEAATTG
jgi:hypothetical protein